MKSPDQAGAGSAEPMPLEDTRTIAPDAGLAVASFIAAKDLARGDKLFFGPGRALRRSLGALAVLAVLTLVAALGATALGVRLPREVVLGAAGATLGFSALWFLASLFRRHPARVCYVRANAGPGAIRFMRELRPYGHVIACRAADGAGGPSARTIASRLRSRFMLNLRTLFSDQQTLTLSAAPVLTQLLARSSDALVVDLSNGKPVDWDIIQSEAARCVFVSAWGLHAQAEATFASLGLPGQCFFYAPDGEIQRRGLFRAALLAAMRAAHPA